jgi:hypothetical protein
MRALLVISSLLWIGCDTSVCHDVDGTCVALTVDGSGNVDGVQLALSGAASGTRIAPKTADLHALPIDIALQLPSAQTGTLHIDAVGLLLGGAAGAGSVDVPITAGQHQSAHVTLTPGGVVSGGGDGGANLPFDVTGTRVKHYVLGDGGVVDVPQDNSGIGISAEVPVDGGIVSIAGSGDANGNFTIKHVPSKPFYLVYNGYYMLSSAMNGFDLGYWVMGRPDQTFPTTGTTLHLGMTNLTAWDPADTLEFFSMNAGTAIFGPEKSSPVGMGATSYTATVDLNQVAFGGLINQSKGDDAFILQLVGDTNNGVPYLRLDTIGNFPPFTVADGANMTVSTAMTAVTQSGSLPLTWTRSQFAQYRTAVNPQAVADTDSFTVFAQPGGLTHGWFTSTPDVAIALPPAGTSDVSLTMSYGNPFPASWPLVGAATSTYKVTFAAAGATSATFDGQITTFTPLASLPPAVVPVVSPVTSPTVDGTDASGGVPTISAMPVIAWSAPAVGTPTSYTVDVFSISNVGGKTSLDDLATFYTTGTSITIPPGLLAGGQDYFVRIRAQADAIDRTLAPFEKSFPTASADVVTGSLHVGLVAQAASCKELHAAHPDYPDGFYTIDVDGSGAASPVAVYCDMTSDGGGWTLCAWAQSGNGEATTWAAPGQAFSSNWYACQLYSATPAEARIVVSNPTTTYSNLYTNVDLRPTLTSEEDILPSVAKSPNIKLQLLPNSSACNNTSQGNFQWGASTAEAMFGKQPANNCGNPGKGLFIDSAGAKSNGCAGSGQVPPFLGYGCGSYGDLGIHMELYVR